jgi:hypothetical protein
MNCKITHLLSIKNIGFIAALALCFTLFSQGLNAVCWVETYGRGVGAIPDQCPRGAEKSGLICYKKCGAGYTLVAGVCWQNCPAGLGLRDDGAFCAKPEAYGRGVGYPWTFDDPAFDLGPAAKRCEAQNKNGCEQDGLIWYPKCKPGFHKVGCCICSPDCPKDMVDIGVSCTKKTYLVDIVEPTCAEGQQNDAGLCYKQCGQGFKPVGPICWGECPAGMESCGGALCADTKRECTETITGQVMSTLRSAVKIAGAVFTGGASLLGDSGSIKDKNQTKQTPSTTGSGAAQIAEELQLVKARTDALDLLRSTNDQIKDIQDKLLAQNITDKQKETLNDSWKNLIFAKDTIDRSIRQIDKALTVQRVADEKVRAGWVDAATKMHENAKKKGMSVSDAKAVGKALNTASTYLNKVPDSAISEIASAIVEPDKFDIWNLVDSFGTLPLGLSDTIRSFKHDICQEAPPEAVKEETDYSLDF